MVRMLPVLAVVLTRAAAAGAAAPPACDPASVDELSYRLVTEAQALNVTAERTSWWDGFALGRHEEALDDLNGSAVVLAERALQADPANVMAHAVLARQYVVSGEDELAESSWRKTLDAGLSVAWTATLYDVDARTYFVVTFDRDALRIYQMAAFGPVERGFYGIPKFPGPSNAAFWRALAGCPGEARPEAVVPWSQVREIKAGNWVLWFKLTQPVRVASDRNGKAKTLKEIKLALHGETGTLEVYKPVGGEEPALRGVGPAAYQDRVRRTLVRFVDPNRRISLPALRPGAGW